MALFCLLFLLIFYFSHSLFFFVLVLPLLYQSLLGVVGVPLSIRFHVLLWFWYCSVLGRPLLYLAGLVEFSGFLFFPFIFGLSFVSARVFPPRPILHFAIAAFPDFFPPGPTLVVCLCVVWFVLFSLQSPLASSALSLVSLRRDWRSPSRADYLIAIAVLRLGANTHSLARARRRTSLETVSLNGKDAVIFPRRFSVGCCFRAVTTTIKPHLAATLNHSSTMTARFPFVVLRCHCGHYLLRPSVRCAKSASVNCSVCTSCHPTDVRWCGVSSLRLPLNNRASAAAGTGASVEKAHENNCDGTLGMATPPWWPFETVLL